MWIVAGLMTALFLWAFFSLLNDDPAKYEGDDE